jgi:hypothetical protein
MRRALRPWQVLRTTERTVLHRTPEPTLVALLQARIPPMLLRYTEPPSCDSKLLTAGPKTINPAMASTATKAMIRPYSTRPCAGLQLGAEVRHVRSDMDGSSEVLLPASGGRRPRPKTNGHPQHRPMAHWPLGPRAMPWEDSAADQAFDLSIAVVI